MRGLLVLSFIYFVGCQSNPSRPGTESESNSANNSTNVRDPASSQSSVDLANQIIAEDETVQNRIRWINSKYEFYFQNSSDLSLALQSVQLLPRTEEEKNRNVLLKKLDQENKDSLAHLSELKLKLEQSNRPWDPATPLEENISFRLNQNHFLERGAPQSVPHSQIVEGSLRGYGDSIGEVCFNKENSSANPLDVFASIKFLNASCIHQADEGHLIITPIEGLQEKLQLLTGTRLKNEDLISANIDARLDFSKAPHFDRIFVSTLEIHQDFTGIMLTRALAFHASRGTQVRLIVPELPALGPTSSADIRFLKKFAAQSRNIKVQFFKYLVKNQDLTDLVQRVERVIHAKIFVALSDSQPELDALIMGGRNLRDGFYFETAPNTASHPEFQQYDPNKYLFYRDLEVELKSPAIAQAVAQQFMAVWMRDMHGPSLSVTSYPVVTQNWNQDFELKFRESLITKNWVRSFVSAPWTDRDHQLENLFGQMIDSAKQSIRFTSPYVRPTPILRQAIRRAIERGIKVQIISNLNLAKDNVPSTSQTGNIKSFNDILQSNEAIKADPEFAETMKPMEIYNWSSKLPTLFHAKTLLVDDELLYIGSANASQRSFNHDIESGLIIMGPLTHEYQNTFDKFFMKNVEPVTKVIKLRFLQLFFLYSFDKMNWN